MDYFLLTTLKSLRFLKIFDIITFLGDFRFLFFIICIVYWKNAKLGLNLIKSTLMATNTAQICKLVFTIPRPFQIYKNINPSQYALSTATGYSFPSGHSQASMSVFGFLANNLSQNWFYVIPFLVAFSRLVLGVHTLRDVIIGLILGLIFIKLTKGNLLVMSLISLLFCAFRYTKGIAFISIQDSLLIGIISLIFLILTQYIDKIETNLDKKKIIIGILPLIISELFFYFIYPIHNIEYIFYVIYMFNYKKMASKF